MNETDVGASDRHESGRPIVPVHDALKVCIQEIYARLAHLTTETQVPTFAEEVWRRGSDGHFRPNSEARPSPEVLMAKYVPKLEVLDTYSALTEAVRADTVLQPQLDSLVGGRLGMWRRFDLPQLVLLIVSRMVPPSGHITFDEGRFEEVWLAIWESLSAPDFQIVTLAPLSIRGPFPMELAPGLTIDQFTEDEVNDCIRGDLLRPHTPTFRVIPASEAVGIRYIQSVAKVIYRSGDPDIPPPPTAGKFGRHKDEQSNITDVVTTLRLFKAGQLKCPGVCTAYSGFLGGWLSFIHRPTSLPHFGAMCLRLRKFQG